MASAVKLLSKQNLLSGRIIVSRLAGGSLRMSSSVSEEAVKASTAGDTHPVVGHDPTHKQFYIKLKDNEKSKAVLDYDWARKDMIDMYHTEVPPVFRGKGIAKLLAKAAMDYAVEKDIKMILTCTYLQKYVKEINPLPEYQERVVES